MFQVSAKQNKEARVLQVRRGGAQGRGAQREEGARFRREREIGFQGSGST